MDTAFLSFFIIWLYWNLYPCEKKTRKNESAQDFDVDENDVHLTLSITSGAHNSRISVFVSQEVKSKMGHVQQIKRLRH